MLQGRFGRLEPLDEAKHGESLWRAVEGADPMWHYLPYGPWRDEKPRSAPGLKERQALADPLYYAVVDNKSGRALGCVTLMRIDQPNGSIETGHIFYSPALQKTPLATEAVFLEAKHAFDDLGYRRFEWKCDNANEPSRRAATPLRLRLRGRLSATSDREGAQPRHGVVLDHRWRVAGAKTGVRALPRAREFRCRGTAEKEPFVAQRRLN